MLDHEWKDDSAASNQVLRLRVLSYALERDHHWLHIGHGVMVEPVGTNTFADAS